DHTGYSTTKGTAQQGYWRSDGARTLRGPIPARMGLATTAPEDDSPAFPLVRACVGDRGPWRRWPPGACSCRSALRRAIPTLGHGPGRELVIGAELAGDEGVGQLVDPLVAEAL